MAALRKGFEVSQDLELEIKGRKNSKWEETGSRLLEPSPL
jgi:hypothetical protein